MATVAWLVCGALMGTLYGGALWYSVQRMRAGVNSRAWVVTLFGAALRVIAVAVLALGLFARSLAAGAWGLLGFLVARSLWCGWVTRGTGRSPHLPTGWPASAMFEEGGIEDPSGERG